MSGKQLLTVLLWLVSLSASAQKDTITDHTHRVEGVSMTDRTHHIDGVTITESRRHHEVTSIAPMHQLDQRDMHVMGVTDIADALHRLPGITLRDYGGAGGMKTVSVRGFGAKHTGVSYDGVMLSECQSGEIDLSRYSLDNVERLTLVVGDNDDIFIPARQAATPAVLHIQTFGPRSDSAHPHLTSQLKWGSFGYLCPYVRYEQPLSDCFSVALTGEYTYAENDYPYSIRNISETVSDRRTHNRMNSGHGEVSWLWTPDSLRLLSGKLYYYDNDRQLPGTVHYYTNLSGESLRDRNFFGQLHYQARWSDKLALRWNGKLNWAESVYKDALYQGGVNDASYWQREGYTSVALLYVPHHQWAFDYSADYAFNNLNGTSQRTVVGKPYRHTVLQSLTAKYRSGRLTMLGRLLASLYLNDSKEGSSARNMRRLSPSLSLSYKPFDRQSLYLRASYKDIFRSPTFNESYYYHYGSLDLRPEQTHQLNVGVTYALVSGFKFKDSGFRFQVTVDGYYNEVTDMIVAVPKNMFVWSCVNVGKVRVTGLETTLHATCPLTAGHQVTLAANYSYQRAQNLTSKESPYYKYQIAYLPLHTASASVGYENPWVNVSLHGMGMSSRWANNEHYEGTEVDGYTDVGLTFWRTLRWGCHQVEGRLDLKNLFDTQYEIVSHYPMPGRSFQLSLNFKL